MSSEGSAATTIWVGGYTEDMGGSALGITVLSRDGAGELHDRGLAAGTPSPSALALAGDMLYAVGEGDATISAFRVKGQELHFVGIQHAVGASPCALALTGSPALLLVACFGDGSIDVHPVASDGSLARTTQSLRDEGRGPRESQDGPHAHAALQVDAATVLTTDLGTDRVHVLGLGPEGLTRRAVVQLPAGTGPRDLLLLPSGIVWVLGELSHEVFALARQGEGYVVVGSTPLSGAVRGDHAASLALSADGRFGYSALRGSNRISIFAAEVEGARLSPLGAIDCGGGWPRHLVVDGEWLHVANQLSDSVDTFRIGHDGTPVPVHSIAVPSPTWLSVTPR